MDFEVLDEEQSREFEETCKAMYDKIFKSIKNHLISRYTGEYLQAKLPPFRSIDDNVGMLTQTILKVFEKYQKDKKTYICQSSVHAESRKLKTNFEVVCNLFNESTAFSMSFTFEDKKVTGDINTFLNMDNKLIETPQVVSMDQTGPSMFDVTVAVKDDD